MTASQAPILITGATGFLGAWIIARLLADGEKVIACDLSKDHQRLDQLLKKDEQENVSWHICDVTDKQAVDDLVAQTLPKAIIHLAALQIPACRSNPGAGAMVNIIGHINIFETALKHGINHIIYTSSIAAKPRGPANAPANFYGVFKRTNEEISRLYWEDHGISSLGLRPFIVYGVGRDDGETSVITKAMQAAALGTPYEMPFKTTSCFQYAGEVAEIFARCTQASWDGALLSDLTTKTNSTDDVIAAILQHVAGAQIKPSQALRISPDLAFDNATLRDVIGEWPATTLIDGVGQTINLYRKLSHQ